MEVLPPESGDPDDRSALAQAVGWASRVTTIALEMALPGLAGYWIDRRLDTGIVFLLLGVGFGFALGLWHLLKLAGGQSEDEPEDEANGTP